MSYRDVRSTRLRVQDTLTRLIRNNEGVACQAIVSAAEKAGVLREMLQELELAEADVDAPWMPR